MLLLYDLFRVLMALSISLIPIWGVFLIIQKVNKKRHESNGFWMAFLVMPWVLFVVYFLPPVQQLFEQFLPAFHMNNPTVPVHMDGRSVEYLRFKIYTEGYEYTNYGNVVKGCLGIWFMGSLYAYHHRRLLLEDIGTGHLYPIALIGGCLWWFHPLMRRGFRLLYEDKKLYHYENKEEVSGNLDYKSMMMISKEQKRIQWILTLFGLSILLLIQGYDSQRQAYVEEIRYKEIQSNNFFVDVALELRDTNYFLTERIFGESAGRTFTDTLVERLNQDGKTLKSLAYGRDKYRIASNFSVENPLEFMAIAIEDIEQRETFSPDEIKRMLTMIDVNNQWLEAYYKAEALMYDMVEDEGDRYSRPIHHIYYVDGEMLYQFADTFASTIGEDNWAFYDFHKEEKEEETDESQDGQMDTKWSQFEYTYSKEEREEAKQGMAEWMQEQMGVVDTDTLRYVNGYLYYKANPVEEGEAIPLEERTQRANHWIEALNQPELSLTSVSESSTQDFKTYFTIFTYRIDNTVVDDRLSRVSIYMRDDGSLYSIDVRNAGIFLDTYHIPTVFLTQEAITSYIPNAYKEMIHEKGTLIIQDEPEYAFHFMNEGAPFILYLDGITGALKRIEPEIPQLERY